jgi:hypothetical protein
LQKEEEKDASGLKKESNIHDTSKASNFSSEEDEQVLKINGISNNMLTR